MYFGGTNDEYASLMSSDSAVHMTVQECKNVFKVPEKFCTYSQAVLVQ